MDTQQRLAKLRQWFLSEDINGGGVARAGAQLCEQLVDMGVPLARGHVLVLLLHPLYHGRSFFWNRSDGVSEQNWQHGQQEQSDWVESIFYALIHGEVPESIRFDLRDPDVGTRFPMLADLRSQGMTDYVAFRIRFANGSCHAASFVTDAPGGFSEEHRALLEGLERFLALRLENSVRRELMGTVLSAYLGCDAAERVLDGRIRLGDTQTIEAVVWMSDLRGFTQLSDRLPPNELLALLDCYFSIVVRSVRQHGGEVLKFIGDAVLAVFRVGERSKADACEAAVRAATDVIDALSQVNQQRERDGQDIICQGVGLHFGSVSYGNVGSRDRLDFTVIGPAVNMAARIEGLCSQLDREVLLSVAVASELSMGVDHLGDYPLKGLSEAVPVYGLIE